MSNEEKVERYQGVTVWFDPRKGFGFIDQDHTDEDLFLHYSNITIEGFKTVKPNQRVSYEIGENHRGAQAVNVLLHEVLDEGE